MTADALYEKIISEASKFESSKFGIIQGIADNVYAEIRVRDEQISYIEDQNYRLKMELQECKQRHEKSQSTPTYRLKSRKDLIRDLVDGGWYPNEEGVMMNESYNRYYFLPEMWEYCGSKVEKQEDGSFRTLDGAHYFIEPEWVEEVYE